MSDTYEYQGTEGISRASGEGAGSEDFSDSALDSYIESTQPVITDEDGYPIQEASSAAGVPGQNQGQVAQQQTMQGTSPDGQSVPSGNQDLSPEPDPRDEYIARLHGVLGEIQETQRQQTAANIQRSIALDEQRFRASLQQMSPEQRQAAIATREALKAKAQLAYVKSEQGRMVTEAQRAEMAQQFVAKETLANMILEENGLPPIMLNALMSSATPDEMEAYGKQLGQHLHQSLPANDVRQARPVDIPGGVTSVAGQATLPEAGSGDLDSLIAATPWQYS